MDEYVTTKDRIAGLIENEIIDLGLTDAATAQDAAILLVQKMETAGLLPTEREFKAGDPTESFEFGADQTAPKPEVFDAPPVLKEGQYLLERLVTPWMGAAL